LNSSLLIKIAEKCALLSFLGGTAILIHYCITDDSSTLSIGLYYVYIVGLINLIILALILWKVYKGNPNRSKLLDAAKVVLLNIPVLFLYLGIVIVLVGYMRITIQNNTQYQIENAKIEGCQEKEIPLLPPGENKTIWVPIPADCSIELTYQLKGETQKEILVEYVTRMGGKKMVYKIDSNND